MKAAIVTAAIGGCVAAIEGLLLIALGSLGGLAENPEGEAAMTDGYVVLALSGIVLAAVLVARRWPLVLALVSAFAAGIGFLVENALWIFAAALLFAAAVLAVASKRTVVRSANRNATP